MPAAPVHHTAVDKTGAWDGPAQEKKFDKKASDLVKFYAWVDEGEHDPDADGTDKEDGWGPHHECDDQGVPHDANLTGVEAAMAALNGAHGTTSRIPDGDRQGVYDHLAAHYVNAGVPAKSIPELASRSSAPGDDHEHRAGFSPAPYSQGDDENVECPSCGRMNDADASYCDQCDTRLEGRDDVSVGGVTQNPYESSQYLQGPDENVRCPFCDCYNMPDAHFCDQCGEKLEGTDAEIAPVAADGEADDDEVVDESSGIGSAGAYVTDPDNRSKVPAEARKPAAAPETTAPTSNIVRARPGSVELRSDPTVAGTGTTMYGHFAVFNEWYEVDSYFEGQFLERIQKGAFADTFAADGPAIRCIYNHGWDEQLGLKPLGPVSVLKEDDTGAYYEVPLLDTDYNRGYVLPALQGRLMDGTTVGSQLGASFRFSVVAESWNMKPASSPANPACLPQRTISACQVMEFGPGMFAVSPQATAGVRSVTAEWFDRLRSDPRFLVRATEKYGPKVVERMLETQPMPDRLGSHETEVPDETLLDERAARIRQQQRRARALLL